MIIRNCSIDVGTEGNGTREVKGSHRTSLEGKVLVGVGDESLKSNLQASPLGTRPREFSAQHAFPEVQGPGIVLDSSREHGELLIVHKNLQSLPICYVDHGLILGGLLSHELSVNYGFRFVDPINVSARSRRNMPWQSFLESPSQTKVSVAQREDCFTLVVVHGIELRFHHPPRVKGINRWSVSMKFPHN